MSRVDVQRQTHGGRYERPFVVRVDGRLLLDTRGATRRFKTEGAARSAGWKAVPDGVKRLPGEAHE